MILLINTIVFALFQLICGCMSSFALIVKLRYLTPNTQSFQNVITAYFVLERIRVVANRLDPPLTSKIDMSSMF